MPKRRVCLWLSEAGQEKLRALAKRYGTQTTAIEVALDRFCVQPAVQDGPCIVEADELSTRVPEGAEEWVQLRWMRTEERLTGDVVLQMSLETADLVSERLSKAAKWRRAKLLEGAE